MSDMYLSREALQVLGMDSRLGERESKSTTTVKSVKEAASKPLQENVKIEVRGFGSGIGINVFACVRPSHFLL